MHRDRHLRIWARCGLLLASAALGGCATAATPAAPRSQTVESIDESSSAAQSADRDWTQLTHEERKAHMRDVVLPTMESHFVHHDRERFANFGCKTCHGPGARERNYAMPCPDLPTLYPTGSQEQIDTVKQHRAMATFMHQRVTPTMRELLGLPRYDETTGQGFSCFYCHPRGEPQ